LPQNLEIERRLAAVLAADVAGFSRLTEQDEVGTMRLLAAQRAILDSAIARHKGRIANTAGDSVLAEFPSAVNAVQCAVEAQQALRDAAEDAAEDRRVLFRIGIHVGDVMVRGGDLLGGGVNVAARLEALADAGGIVISAAAHEQVKKILPLAYADLGPQSVKNIEEPVRAFAIGSAPATATVVFPGEGQPLPLPDRPSIVVLPFQNMSGDPEQEYFADGIVEDITTALSRFKELFVIARNSSFSYKGRAVDVRQVGRELGVRYVLEGSVRRAPGQLRITAQLVDSTSGAHLWADRFDGALGDIFALQDRVTETVVNAIAPRVEQAEIERTRTKTTGHLDAYDLYLRGVAGLNLVTAIRGTESDAVLAAARQAKSLFLDATRADPNFARAYGHAAQCCLIESQFAGAAPNRSEIVAEAIQLSRRAASIGRDDALALTYAAQTLAYVAGLIDEGTVLIERALSLNSNLALAWNFGGWINIFRGEPERGIERFSRAMRLNPFDPYLFLMQLGTACGHLFSGNHDVAAQWADKALQERPRITIGLRLAASCYAMAGRLEDARRAVDILRELAPGFRIAQVPTLFPLRRPEDLAKYCEGLRLAGLPE
jgi:adenylate cyclase